MLADPSLDLAPRFRGQLRNQRGIILAEVNRLPEALEQTEEALDLLRAAGERSHEARTLVNLGAITSMMGRLDDAERWYEEARDCTVATGQHVVAAGIEGNLGYVASRRGRYTEALDWYERARASFARLGGVDLLVAVLEIDHARTLLDVGLASDAARAAERAVRSATSGGNQMLETQGRLLRAEALIAVDDRRQAELEVRRGSDLAERLGQTAWHLRAMHLAAELGIALRERRRAPPARSTRSWRQGGRARRSRPPSTAHGRSATPNPTVRRHCSASPRSARWGSTSIRSTVLTPRCCRQGSPMTRKRPPEHSARRSLRSMRNGH